MTRFLLRRLLPALPLVALAGGVGLAQPGQLPPRFAQPMPPAADKDDIEVLARGPIHEAFAATAEMPTGGPVVDRRPPDPVEELPPDQKPDGDNVQWIPGYWQYDDERKDFIWISGFWRDAPPGRVWVPGGWQEVRNGFQWVSGFWNVPAPAAQPGIAPQARLEYLPPPPATLETGPTLVSPGDDHFYTPGCWVYRVNRYVWRPGFWVAHRPNWVWVPDQYRWTPCGFVFVPGFWDVPLERRGVLFAPVFFRPAVVVRPRFVFTPVYAVPAPCLHTSLFVRTGFSNYYFGDFFEPRYATAGFNSWAVGVRGSNFAVGVSGGRGFAYDPLWSYYSVAFRREPAWQRNIADVYAGRFNGTLARPPRTLVQQNTIINTTTVVNNNTTVINTNSYNTATSPVMLAPLADLKKTSPTVALKPVAVEDRTKEQQAAKEFRQVAAERRRAEAQLVARGQVPTRADDKPQQVTVDLSKTAVARAQQPPPKEKAPPPAPTPVVKKPETPIAPPTGAKPGDEPPTPTAPPKTDPPKGPPAKTDPPKVDPPVKANDPPKTGPGTPVPPIGPKPKDPKPPVNPPKNDPPKGPPATPPKVDPPKPGDPPKGPPVSPPKTDPPKVDPSKGPTVPPTVPPVGPKPGDPPRPKDQPKADPPKGPTIPPVTPPGGPKPKDPKPPVSPPKNDLPKGPVIPPPKVDPPKSSLPAAPPPKLDPPKPPVTLPPPKVDPPKPPASPPPKVDPPKANPPKGPGVPSRPTRGDDKKDGKKGDEKK